MYEIYLCLMSIGQVYIIDDLKKKFRLLKDKLEVQKDLTERLEETNQDLEDQLEKQKKELENLKQENNTLKLAKAFVEDGSDTQDAKLQINRIVREIDKCIALLNR